MAMFLDEDESFGINRPYDVYRIIQRQALAARVPTAHSFLVRRT